MAASDAVGLPFGSKADAALAEVLLRLPIECSAEIVSVGAGEVALCAESVEAWVILLRADDRGEYLLERWHPHDWQDRGVAAVRGQEVAYCADAAQAAHLYTLALRH